MPAALSAVNVTVYSPRCDSSGTHANCPDAASKVAPEGMFAAEIAAGESPSSKAETKNWSGVPMVAMRDAGALSTGLPDGAMVTRASVVSEPTLAVMSISPGRAIGSTDASNTASAWSAGTVRSAGTSTDASAAEIATAVSACAAV